MAAVTQAATTTLRAVGRAAASSTCCNCGKAIGEDGAGGAAGAVPLSVSWLCTTEGCSRRACSAPCAFAVAHPGVQPSTASIAALATTGRDSWKCDQHAKGYINTQRQASTVLVLPNPFFCFFTVPPPHPTELTSANATMMSTSPLHAKSRAAKALQPVVVLRLLRPLLLLQLLVRQPWQPLPLLLQLRLQLQQRRPRPARPRRSFRTWWPRQLRTTMRPRT